MASFETNQQTRLILRNSEYDVVLIETPKARGMPTSNEEMETLLWVGRFVESVIRRGKLKKWSMVWRKDVKLYLCQAVVKVTDANVRAALLDHFGGEAIAIGGKKCPGCKGNRTVDGGRADCSDCDATGSVEGTRGPKKCPTCKGKRSVPLGRVNCRHCGGEGTSTPPGPLANFATHGWAALGVAVTWLANPTFVHRILEGTNAEMAVIRRERREDKARRKLAKEQKDAQKLVASADAAVARASKKSKR